MAKLTKAQAKLHEKAVKLLQCKELSEADTRFVFNHYREDANHINSTAGAFFTPYGLARDFRLHIPLNYKDHVKLIDLCAGIGILSYMAARACDNHNQCSVEITCIEINQDYVDVGKQLLPEATWICSDALDPALLSSLGHFDCAISNPPFGRIHSPYRRNYSSSQFEYMVIEAAASIADAGVFIIPQISAPFVYSGTIMCAGGRQAPLVYLSNRQVLNWILMSGSTHHNTRLIGMGHPHTAKSSAVILPSVPVS